MDLPLNNSGLIRFACILQLSTTISTLPELFSKQREVICANDISVNHFHVLSSQTEIVIGTINTVREVSIPA